MIGCNSKDAHSKEHCHEILQKTTHHGRAKTNAPIFGVLTQPFSGKVVDEQTGNID